MALTEPEKPVVFLMGLGLVVGLGVLGERLVFMARSTPASARVLSRASEAVEVGGTISNPRTYEVDYTEIAVAFEDAQGRVKVSDLRYFFEPEGEQVEVRWREADPLDVRRAGFDLFAIPLLLVVPIVPLEWLRRWTRRRGQAR